MKIRLKENDILLTSLTDVKNQIPDAQWDVVKAALIEFVMKEESVDIMQDFFLKAFLFKKLSGYHFELKDDLEKRLKTEIRQYYTSLDFNTEEKFIESILNLPLTFTYKLFVYIVYICLPAKIKIFEPKKSEVEEFYRECVHKKKEILLQIQQAVNGVGNFFEITLFADLLQLGFFNRTEELEVAVLEYVMRMLNNSNSGAKIEELFGTDFIRTIKKTITERPNYAIYIADLKSSKAIPYFTLEGVENTSKSPTFSELVKEKYQLSDLIPPEFPWRIDTSNQESSIEEESSSVEEPSQEENSEEITGVLNQEEPEIKVV